MISHDTLNNTSDSDEETVPYVDPRYQALLDIEQRASAGLEVIHLGASSLGLNIKLTPEAREDIVDGLAPSYGATVERLKNKESLSDLSSFN